MPVNTIARTSQTSSFTSAITSTPTLSRGASGSAVSELQTLLKSKGISVSVDGDFGPKTQAAVKQFQNAKGLTADGIVGPKTWAALKATSTTPPSTGSTSSTPTLRQGDLGGDVVKLQNALAKHGFSAGAADGNFGPATRSSVVQFQRAKGLSADGVVGAATWKALNAAPSTTPTGPVTSPGANGSRQKILDIARGEIGTTESGTNRGEMMKYPSFFGRGSEAWCADFTSWVMNKSGLKMNDPYTPSVVNTLKASGNWKGKTNPQPGDLVLFDWDGDKKADHIGIVEKVNSDGSIGTIEGNTENPQTGQEGVWRRTRTLGTVLGFGNPY